MKKKFVIFVLVVVAISLVYVTGTYNLPAAYAEESVSYTIDKK